MTTLTKIQNELKAPKNQYNNFGKYKYRNCEDILEAVKPILLKHNAELTITDCIKELAGILFIESRAVLAIGEQLYEVTAQAGIDTNRKGMDIAQCFGASSSYARKYALNGLFLIDDTKDADTDENTAQRKAEPKYSEIYLTVADHLKKCTTLDEMSVLFDSLEEHEQKECKALFTKRKVEINNKINVK